MAYTQFFHDPAAPWMGPDGKPGASPFKPEGNVFERVPGCTPERIKPDLVHTFHIGFGADLAASRLFGWPRETNLGVFPLMTNSGWPMVCSKNTVTKPSATQLVMSGA